MDTDRNKPGFCPSEQFDLISQPEGDLMGQSENEFCCYAMAGLDLFSQDASGFVFMGFLTVVECWRQNTVYHQQDNKNMEVFHTPCYLLIALLCRTRPVCLRRAGTSILL